METLQLLGVALGLATLAGINLYLTVFVSGLAIQQGWITLFPQYEQLAVLADPLIIGVSGVLFVLEFFADKVPWVDSLWDAVHTVIRPVGGAMLAITALGSSHPVYEVIIGLLAGGMALTTHGAKAGARLLVNASPEPFSNIGLSVAEDATVLAGLGLVYNYPVVAFVVAVLSVGLIVWFAPRAFRAARAMLWFVWKRVHYALGVAPSPATDLPELPPDLEIALARARGDDAALVWAAPCVVASNPVLRCNTFGWLLFTSGEKGGLDFARNVESNPQLTTISVERLKAMHRRGLICDQVVVYYAGEGRKHVFQFDRSRRDVAAALVRTLGLRKPEEKPELAAVT